MIAVESNPDSNTVHHIAGINLNAVSNRELLFTDFCGRCEGGTILSLTAQL
jgi:hypothetical protein